MAPTLRGEKVTLRPPRQSDIEFALRFANDEELRGWLRFWHPITETDERAWLEAAARGDEPVWFMEVDERLVGAVSLTSWDRVARHAELGLGILDGAHRGRGIGTEAVRLALRYGFDGLGLQRIHLNVLVDNPAVRLYERLGFRIEGTLRRHGYKRGAWRDHHVMALLREEWRA